MAAGKGELGNLAVPCHCGSATDLHSSAALCRLLLDLGADPSVGHKDDSPLSLASWNGHLAVVRLLLQCGADPDSKQVGLRSSRHVLAQCLCQPPGLCALTWTVDDWHFRRTASLRCIWRRCEAISRCVVVSMHTRRCLLLSVVFLDSLSSCSAAWSRFRPVAQISGAQSQRVQVPPSSRARVDWMSLCSCPVCVCRADEDGEVPAACPVYRPPPLPGTLILFFHSWPAS